MTRQQQGYLYLTLAMTTVGSTVIASKLIAAGLPPFTATALRFAVALPFFLLLMRVTGARFPRLPRHDWGILVIQAAAGSVGYTTMLISGLSITSAANAGVIIGTLPVVSAAISILLLGERPDRFLLLAIGLAAAGVLSIVFAPGTGHGSLIGDIMIAGAVLCEGLFILLNKRLRTAIPPLAQSALMAAIGLVAAAIPALFESQVMSAASGTALLSVLYYALVPTVAGFMLWYAGAERVSGSEASLFTAVAPVSAVIFAFVLLGEPVSLNQVVGIGAVLAAVAGLAFAVRRRGAA